MNKKKKEKRDFRISINCTEKEYHRYVDLIGLDRPDTFAYKLFRQFLDEYAQEGK